MVNMNVGWAGPNPSLAKLAGELNARFGPPKRHYEYVTGYKSPTNITSHNADAYGRGHGMDIFVGAGHNISVEQGIDLAERLRLEGKKGSIPGHPDRLAYIIHRGRICGDHTGWEWVAYNGVADHYDHIHISSVFDYYWGDVVAGNPDDYNSTAAWNLWGATLEGQAGNIIPIPQEDELSAAEVNQIIKAVENERITIVNEVRAHTAHNANRVGDTVRAEAYSTKVFAQTVMNENGDRIIIDHRAQIAGLAEVIKQLATANGAGVDIDAVLAAAKEGATQAIAENVVKVDISIAKPEVTATEVAE